MSCIYGKFSILCYVEKFFILVIFNTLGEAQKLCLKKGGQNLKFRFIEKIKTKNTPNE